MKSAPGFQLHGLRLKSILLTIATFVYLTCMSLAVIAESVENMIAQAAKLEVQGKFKEAAAALNKANSDSAATEAQRRSIGFELDRLNRIKRDYSLTREDLYAELQKAVRDVKEEEFDKWIREGRFDSRVIDGSTYYMGSSVSNLFFRHSELSGRRITPGNAAELAMAKWQLASEIKAAAKQAGSPYVMPKTLEATMTVALKPGAAKKGDDVRAWLPIPRAYPFQKNFEIVRSAPAVSQVAPEDSPVRSAFLQQKGDDNGMAKFDLTYRFTTYAVSFDLDPAKARKPNGSEELQKYTAEAPHIVFTPEMRKLGKEIAGSESNPLLRAKRYYDWIGENIKYSYAIEYSTIRNISDYCRAKGYGDCGQEALLFMTLCRMDGIPARWQSGWNLFPKSKTIHDWCEIYLEPWGWFPVDPYMSIFATRYATSLDQQQRRELRDFYFGGLDQYRMSANCDHSQELSPAKQGYRSDTVDFQRGELDVNGRNVYYDQFSYGLEYKEVVP